MVCVSPASAVANSGGSSTFTFKGGTDSTGGPHLGLTCGRALHFSPTPTLLLLGPGVATHQTPTVTLGSKAPSFLERLLTNNRGCLGIEEGRSRHTREEKRVHLHSPSCSRVLSIPIACVTCGGPLIGGPVLFHN